MNIKGSINILLLLIVALVATVSALSWRLGYRAAVASIGSATITTKADTLIVRDTVTVECPVPILTTITDTLRIAYPDIITIRDTVFVHLPVETKVYRSPDYRAIVSGVRPSLDTIEIYQKKLIVSNPPVIPPLNETQQKHHHWSIALQVGYGLTIHENRITSLPYIGAGLSYSLVEW